MKTTKGKIVEYPEGRAEYWDVPIRGGATGLRVLVFNWLSGVQAGKAEVILVAGDGRTAFFQEFEKVTCEPETIDQEVRRLMSKADDVAVFAVKDADAFYKALIKYLENPSEDEKARLGVIFAKHHNAILNRIPDHYPDKLPYKDLALLVGFAVGVNVLK